jgi:hypothetical protein
MATRCVTVGAMSRMAATLTATDQTTV